MSNPGPVRAKRLPVSTFDLPVQEMRRGYLSDIYFWREKVVLERHGLHPDVTMQVFQRREAILCGTDEALAVLHLAAGRYRDPPRAYRLFDRHLELKRRLRHLSVEGPRDDIRRLREERNDISEELDGLWESGIGALSIDALHDGDAIAPFESVMHIRGDAAVFAHLETLVLGVLARRTRIATNVRRVVDAACGKTVLYFPARFDHWAMQGGDGYAAHIGGAHGVSTEAQAEWWGANASGTVPHALIAAVGGDTVGATRLFHQAFPEERLIALVDFTNDCVGTALDCARALGDPLWGVRLDTSGHMVDRSILDMMGDFDPRGVVPQLVFKTREALDREGYSHVKIVVSGGFDEAKIRRFEEAGAPVDGYGVGSAFMRGSFDYTADIVQLDRNPCAKAGRWFRPNPRLTRA